MASLDPEDEELVLDDYELYNDDDDIPAEDPADTLDYITDEEPNPLKLYGIGQEQELPLKLYYSTIKENKLIIYGFIRNINNESIPSEIKNICLNYSYINITVLFKDNKSWWDMLMLVKNECYGYNFLLSEQICLQYIYNNHKEKASFHSMLGMVYSRMKLPQKAEYQYKQSMLLSPHNDAYLWNYAALLRQYGRYKEAAKLLEKAMGMGTNDIAYKFEYAKCMEFLNDTEYKEKYENVVYTLKLSGGRGIVNKKYQRDAKNHLYKAVSWKMLGDIERSDDEYKDYLEKINMNLLQENFTAFARLLYFLEKYDDALVFLDKAIIRNRPNPFTFYYYGLIMKIKCEYKKAKESLEKALMYSSDFVKCEREYAALINTSNKNNNKTV
eukprot:236803_1